MLGQVEIGRCAEAGSEGSFADTVADFLVCRPVQDDHQSNFITRWSKKISTNNNALDSRVILVPAEVSEG